MSSRTKERKATEVATPTTFAMDAARDAFADLINRAGYGAERIIVTRHGTPIAAIIGLRDLAKLEPTET